VKLLLLAFAGQLPATLLLAQAVPEPYAVLAQYGLAGILGALLIRRYDNELNRERGAREKADSQRDALTERVVSDLVPLVSEVQRTMVPAVERLTQEVQRMGERLDRGNGRQV
jgi:hypothetical protein